MSWAIQFLSLVLLLGYGHFLFLSQDALCLASTTNRLSTSVSYNPKIGTRTTSTHFSSSSFPDIVLSGGLVNLGNTCYLNAQLQCAFHIPVVRDLILNETSSKKRSTNTSCSRALMSLGHVFHLMKTASMQGHGQLDQISSASTAVLCRNLGINVGEQQGRFLLHPFLHDITFITLYN